MSDSTERGGACGHRSTGSLMLIGSLAAWFTVIAASQHPQRVFDRVRHHDHVGLTLPNWRFFAPEPAQHDFHVLHRVLTGDEEQTPWSESCSITPRAVSQMVWFPSRRREKALFDICGEVLSISGRPELDVTRFPAYRMLMDHVARTVADEYADRPRPQGFQFVIARHTGFETEPDPEYLFISPYIPMPELVAARAA